MSGVASTKGQKGEILVAIEVSSLDKSTYHAFHNITLEADEGSSLIDHVIISRFGVFVVETHTHNGFIYGDESQSEWTCELGENKRKFRNPLRQGYWHIKALSTLLGLPDNLFYSIIAFCGETEFRTPMPANVMTSGYSSYIRGKSARLISEAEVQRLAEKLKGLMLSGGEDASRIHIDSLRSGHGASNVSGNVHKLPQPAKTQGESMALLLQKLREHLTRQPKERLMKLGGAAAAGLAVIVLLFSLVGGSDETGTSAQLQPANSASQNDSSSSRLEPSSMLQAASTESDLPKMSEKELKEEAWKRWYTEPEKCKRITDGNRVECANYYIAAKRRFESLYEAGKFNQD